MDENDVRILLHEIRKVLKNMKDDTEVYKQVTTVLMEGMSEAVIVDRFYDMEVSRMRSIVIDTVVLDIS